MDRAKAAAGRRGKGSAAVKMPTLTRSMHKTATVAAVLAMVAAASVEEEEGGGFGGGQGQDPNGQGFGGGVIAVTGMGALPSIPFWPNSVPSSRP